MFNICSSNSEVCQRLMLCKFDVPQLLLSSERLAEGAAMPPKRKGRGKAPQSNVADSEPEEVEEQQPTEKKKQPESKEDDSNSDSTEHSFSHRNDDSHIARKLQWQQMRGPRTSLSFLVFVGVVAVAAVFVAVAGCCCCRCSWFGCVSLYVALLVVDVFVLFELFFV